MALYRYRCVCCGAEDDVRVPMDDRKTPTPCVVPGCDGEMHRIFGEVAHSWRDAKGRETRPPSKPWNWEDGRPVECAEFKRRNPTAGNVGSNPRG